MTSVLKPDQSRPSLPVRALDWGALDQHAGHGEQTPAIDPEIIRLRAEVTRLGDELSNLKAAEPELIALAREDGREDAVRGFKADDTAKLSALQVGLEAALETARPAFANVERIALLLAERALANAFDDASLYRDQIARTIRRQTALLGAHSVLRVEVSRTDFADNHALAELARTLGPGDLQVEARDGLAQGQARLCLTLGEVEIDLPRYWADVKALLSNLAAEPMA